MERITLASLAEKLCWVAWQTELRNPTDAKPTKVPYSPHGRQKAQANNSRTWGTRTKAETRADDLPKPFGLGGVGVELCMLAGTGLNIGGVDLDACRDHGTGEIAPWALSIIGLLESYTEISPSGTGVKVFFVYRTADATMLRKAMDPTAPADKLKHSRTWARRGDGDHPPAIELHLSNRYFAVTDQILPDCTDELRDVPAAMLLRLINVDGPEFVGNGNTELPLGADEKDETVSPFSSHAKGKRTTIGNLDKSRSAAAFQVGAKARRDGATFEQMCKAIRDHADTADWYREKGEPNGGRELQRIWEKTDPANDDLILQPGAPYATAKRYLGMRHVVDGARTMHHQNATFYEWQGSHYVERASEEMRAKLYAFLHEAKRIDDNHNVVDFAPTKNKVANVLEATAAEAQISRVIRPPAWLHGDGAPKAEEIIACSNALLHLPTGETSRHTPHFFTLNALPFDYNSKAAEPVEWLKFLRSAWPDDQQAIDTLQEIFGLCLTAETRHQKIFMIVGPKRSGKGTIARVMTQLIGPDNAAGPTLSGLGTNFGLAPLIGKRVAIISDARLGGKVDQQVIVERLLSVSGEDGLTIDRKFRDGWTGKLDARFVILTNEMPRLTDSSGALAGRFVILKMTQSFYGKEDLALGAKLQPEMPGILLWAIEGWKRLTQRGFFVPPASSRAAQQEMEDLGSPIGAFLRDRCVVGQGNEVRSDDIYRVWCAWCHEQGRDHVGTKPIFGRDLASAIPGLTITQHVIEDGSRKRFYEGVALDPDKTPARDNTRADTLWPLLDPDDPGPSPGDYPGFYN